MPSRSDLPSELNRDKFTKALERLGFVISKKGGKGNHYKATYKNGKIIIIPSSLRRDVLYYLLKGIEMETSISWNDIKSKL